MMTNLSQKGCKTGEYFYSAVFGGTTAIIDFAQQIQGMIENFYGCHRSKYPGRGNFEKIPNGAPGLELRLPLLFNRALKAG